MDIGCGIVLGIVVLIAAVAIGRSVSRSREASANRATLKRRESLMAAVERVAATASPEEVVKCFARTAQNLGADASDIGIVYGRLAWKLIESGAFLDEREDRVLQLLRERFTLGVTEDIASAVEQFRRFRNLKGTLPVVAARAPLKKGETCHHVTTGEVLKHTGGTLRKGDVMVTSKRVLIVGNGSTSLDYIKMLRVELDPFRREAAFTMDGRENAVRVIVPDVIYTTMIAKLAFDNA